MGKKKNGLRLLGLGVAGMMIVSGSSMAAAAESGITPESFKEALSGVASRTRYVGTEGEKAAAEEIASKMESYGYEVTRQVFPYNELGQEATNVIAVKKADSNPNGDILIVSAHHDSRESTVGADDNASGTAMVLELARLMKDVTSDTEIRFVTFSAEEVGVKGSSWYVSRLSDEEKAHIVGDIQIDMIGHYMMEDTMLKAVVPGENLLSDMLAASAEKVTGKVWEKGIETASDHSSFVFAGIPGIMVAQDGIGAENHRFSDDVRIINCETAAEVGAVIEDTLKEIAGTDTESLCEEARAQLAEGAGHVMTDRMPILFGGLKNEVEIKAGCSGVFEKEVQDEDFGWTMEHYVAQLKWFGWEEALPTAFVYRKLDDGTLTLWEVNIRTESLNLTDEELGERLTALFGEPEIVEMDRIWGGTNEADNPSLRRYQLGETKEGQVIRVVEGMHSLMGVDLKNFDFKTDPKEYEGTCDAADMAILEIMHKIIPADNPYVGDIISWTDGYSMILGTCLPRDEWKSDCFDIRIDKNDVVDEEGNLADIGKMLAVMVHEYGHALTLNADQIDVSKFGAHINYNDASIYRENSYLKAYYDLFYAEDKKREFGEHPEDFVDGYAGEGGIYEDIVETFMVFVTSFKPEGDTIAAQKVRFFYEYPEMVELRDYIRGNFGYPAE